MIQISPPRGIARVRGGCCAGAVCGGGGHAARIPLSLSLRISQSTKASMHARAARAEGRRGPRREDHEDVVLERFLILLRPPQHPHTHTHSPQNSQAHLPTTTTPSRTFCSGRPRRRRRRRVSTDFACSGDWVDTGPARKAARARDPTLSTAACVPCTRNQRGRQAGPRACVRALLISNPRAARAVRRCDAVWSQKGES
jgi:hypothetical protein